MYANVSLRERVVTSAVMLIAALVLTVGLWLMPYWAEPDSYYTLGAVLLSAYSMLYLVNRYGLIRVRSRMTTTAMLVLLTLVIEHEQASLYTLLPLLLILVYASTLATGREGRSEVWVFHAFVWLGVLVLIAPLTVVLLPAIYLSLLIGFHSLRVRGLSASLLGLLVPLLAVVAVGFWQPAWGVSYWQTVWLPLANLSWLDYSALSVSQIAVYACLLLLSLPALMHVLMTMGEDKPQVRACFVAFAIVQVVLLLAAVALPTTSAVWWPLLAVNSSPLVAHHLVLSRHPLTDLWFYVVVVIVGAAFFFNMVWMG